jgi:hypothetical protein
MVAGSASAHGLSYRIVAPDPSARAGLLESTGHGYLDRLPLLLGVLGALLLAGLALRMRSPGAGSGRLQARLLFLLPVAAFALQEHLERLVHDGSLPLAAALEPTFLVGLLLQLPFSLAAYALATALLEVADRISSAFAKPRSARLRAVRSPLRPLAAAPPRFAALALGYGTRGPPVISG